MPHPASDLLPRRGTPWLAIAALLALPAAAQADPTVSTPQPVPSSGATELAPKILPMAAVPSHANQVVHDQRPAKLGAKVLFVNFDGVDMNACGNNNPHQNCSTIFGGTVLPFSGDTATRAAIIQSVRSRVEDFGISVTNTRPESGDYDMEVVGAWQGQNVGFAGIAPAGDCWDNTGGEVSFTLDVAGNADGSAEIILQELAHTWGLDHVDVQQDLLYPTTQGNNKTFRDECNQIVADTDLNPTQGFCSHHEQACGNYSQQNSYQEMMMIFGPSTPDAVAPTVQILEPAHGDIIEGGDFTLRVAVADDQVPTVFDTWITFDSPALDEPIESTAAYAGPAELEFPVTGLPNGDFEITVVAEDEGDNPTEASITIRIEGSEVPGGDDGGEDDDDGAADGGSGEAGGDGDDGDGDGGDDGEGGGEGGAGTGDDGAAADDGGQNDDGGCTVDAGGQPAKPVAVLFLMLLATALPRRRH